MGSIMAEKAVISLRKGRGEDLDYYAARDGPLRGNTHQYSINIEKGEEGVRRYNDVGWKKK